MNRFFSTNVVPSEHERSNNLYNAKVPWKERKFLPLDHRVLLVARINCDSSLKRSARDERMLRRIADRIFKWIDDESLPRVSRGNE